MKIINHLLMYFHTFRCYFWHLHNYYLAIYFIYYYNLQFLWHPLSSMYWFMSMLSLLSVFVCLSFTYCTILYYIKLKILNSKIYINHFLITQVCYKIVHAYERPQFQQDMTVIMAEEEKDGCPRCNGQVCKMKWNLKLSRNLF